jgi:hypothetical protein
VEDWAEIRRLHRAEGLPNKAIVLVSSRYERASLIVTSNNQFGRWGEVFGDDVVATHRRPHLDPHRTDRNLVGM